MCYLYTCQSKPGGQQHDGGDEEETTSGAGQQVGSPRIAAGLGEHVAYHAERVERIGKELPSEGAGTYLYDQLVVAEESDEGLGIDDAGDTADKEKSRADLNGEPECRLQPVVKACTKAETAGGLEALAKSDDSCHHEHRDTCHDAHGGDGFVTKVAGRDIQRNGSDAPQPLSGQLGAAAIENFFDSSPGRREVAP